MERRDSARDRAACRASRYERLSAATIASSKRAILDGWGSCGGQRHQQDILPFVDLARAHAGQAAGHPPGIPRKGERADGRVRQWGDGACARFEDASFRAAASQCLIVPAVFALAEARRPSRAMISLPPSPSGATWPAAGVVVAATAGERRVVSPADSGGLRVGRGERASAAAGRQRSSSLLAAGRPEQLSRRDQIQPDVGDAGGARGVSLPGLGAIGAARGARREGLRAAAGRRRGFFPLFAAGGTTQGAPREPG